MGRPADGEGMRRTFLTKLIALPRWKLVTVALALSCVATALAWVALYFGVSYVFDLLTGYPRHFDQVRVGMSRSTVIQIMGRPDDVYPPGARPLECQRLIGSITGTLPPDTGATVAYWEGDWWMYVLLDPAGRVVDVVIGHAD